MSTRVKTKIAVTGKLDGLTAVTAQHIVAVETAISQPTKEYLAEVLTTAYEVHAVARDTERALAALR